MTIHPTNVINLSIKLNTLPSKCEIEKVKPLFKKGSKSEAKNYRPISLLSLISKVIGKTIHDQTQLYLQRNKLLYSYQSDFRTNNSRDKCLSQLTDVIKKLLTP